MVSPSSILQEGTVTSVRSPQLLRRAKTDRDGYRPVKTPNRDGAHIGAEAYARVKTVPIPLTMTSADSLSVRSWSMWGVGYLSCAVLGACTEIKRHWGYPARFMNYSLWPSSSSS